MTMSAQTIKDRLAATRARRLQSQTSHLLSDREVTVFWEDVLPEEVDDLIAWLKANTWSTNATALKYVDNPVVEKTTLSGRWRGAVIRHEPGTRAGLDADAQGVKFNIYLTLRKGYAATIDWAEARLTAPARGYNPVTETVEVLFPNLDYTKLKQLAESITSPLQSPIINGETYTGSWVKTDEVTGQAEDGSGFILLRISKGGRSLTGVNVPTNCTVTTTKSWYYDQTQGEIDALAVTVAALTLQPGWEVDFDVQRGSSERATWNAILSIRKATVDAAANKLTLNHLGRRLLLQKDVSAVPTSADIGNDREIVFAQLQKNDRCTIDAVIQAETIPAYLQTYNSADGRTTIRGEFQPTAPTLPSGATLVALSIKGKIGTTAGQIYWDFEITYDDPAVSARLDRADGGAYDYTEVVYSGINQAALPTLTPSATVDIEIDYFQPQANGRLDFRIRKRTWSLANRANGGVKGASITQRRQRKFGASSAGYYIHHQKRTVTLSTSRTHSLTNPTISAVTAEHVAEVVQVAPHVWATDDESVNEGVWVTDTDLGSGGVEFIAAP